MSWFTELFGNLIGAMHTAGWFSKTPTDKVAPAPDAGTQTVRSTPGEYVVAYDALLAQWQCGNRDREVALHLMFLAWYLCAEPTFLTGADPRVSRRPVFIEVHDHLRARDPLDPEFTFVVSHMASFYFWCCGDDEHQWSTIADQYQQSYWRAESRRLSAEDFEGRGLYGAYFAFMVEAIG